MPKSTKNFPSIIYFVIHRRIKTLTMTTMTRMERVAMPDLHFMSRIYFCEID